MEVQRSYFVSHFSILFIWNIFLCNLIHLINLFRDAIDKGLSPKVIYVEKFLLTFYLHLAGDCSEIFFKM